MLTGNGKQAQGAGFGRAGQPAGQGGVAPAAAPNGAASGQGNGLASSASQPPRLKLGGNRQPAPDNGGAGGQLSRMTQNRSQAVEKPSLEQRNIVLETKGRVQNALMEVLDLAKAATLPREELTAQINEIVGEILVEQRINLNMTEQRDLVTRLVDDMIGLGPLEPLLADEAVTDIMVNGAKRIFVERHGKIVESDITFHDDQHVLNTCVRIASRVGRRVDESSPLVDARLADGSRVNIIIPPLALDGPSISIRKFSEKRITLEKMVKQGNMSPEMGVALMVAGCSRCNILISGGTGSGKTTLLNAISETIDPTERIVTIEDAAELKLAQPNLVRLETRPPNLEGDGEINMRDLVKNALRMRPDRIILGEVRGPECVDMLQAMNTGHDGSLGTIHSNNPREALTRLENLIAMAGYNLPHKAVRTQIASALDLIVQVSRQRDGMRRITHITEIVGMDGDTVLTQDLFNYEFEREDEDGNFIGKFDFSGIRPRYLEKAKFFSLDQVLVRALHQTDGDHAAEVKQLMPSQANGAGNGPGNGPSNGASNGGGLQAAAGGARGSSEERQSRLAALRARAQGNAAPASDGNLVH